MVPPGVDPWQVSKTGGRLKYSTNLYQLTQIQVELKVQKNVDIVQVRQLTRPRLFIAQITAVLLFSVACHRRVIRTPIRPLHLPRRASPLSASAYVLI